MKKLLMILMILLFVSCTETKYIVRTKTIYRYPKKTNKIDKPPMNDLGPTQDYNSDENIERRLKNLAELRQYINQLKNKIGKYEKDIDEIMKEEEMAKEEK